MQLEALSLVGCLAQMLVYAVSTFTSTTPTCDTCSLAPSSGLSTPLFCAASLPAACPPPPPLSFSSSHAPPCSSVSASFPASDAVAAARSPPKSASAAVLWAWTSVVWPPACPLRVSTRHTTESASHIVLVPPPLATNWNFDFYLICSAPLQPNLFDFACRSIRRTPRNR